MTEVTKKKFESEKIMKAADKVRRTALMKGNLGVPPTVDCKGANAPPGH